MTFAKMKSCKVSLYLWPQLYCGNFDKVDNSSLTTYIPGYQTALFSLEDKLNYYVRLIAKSHITLLI